MKSAGSIAIRQTARQTSISIFIICDDTGKDFPETTAHSGRMTVKSMILAPMIFPTDREDCFLEMAVIVVTSSGSDVPTATSVTPMTLSGIPASTASALPLSTRRSAPQTIPIVPAINFNIFIIPYLVC